MLLVGTVAFVLFISVTLKFIYTGTGGGYLNNLRKKVNLCMATDEKDLLNSSKAPEPVGLYPHARRVDAGERALLLIDEEPMHGETGPHWILAHARVGDTVVVEDPWVGVDAGETWVDTHELPIRPEDLDRLVRWSDDAYRGVIFTRVG